MSDKEIKVSNTNNSQKHKENKNDKAIEYYIQQKIDWSII